MPNWSLPFITNSKDGSIKKVQHKVLTFDDLWDAYPGTPFFRTFVGGDKVPHIDPETGKELFGNQCAIRVSHALYECGIKLKAFKGTRCWCCPSPDEHGKGIHSIRAQDLADYLTKRPFAGCPKAIEVPASNFDDILEDKKGIIFFKDYWRRKGETQPTGDHIDLWDKNELAGSGFFGSTFRLNYSEQAERYADLSDLHKSKQILFWEIK
ncbi:type VI secretion system amidase effector protein Tae4 [Halodesulfovibrio aestuarii]|uniref:type VI secretion system amidase effector protein Tae4 n=1 Tax=Halodesulfovibrio aestuarii TaxID=126333 RepID=UPI003D33924F